MTTTTMSRVSLTFTLHFTLHGHHPPICYRRFRRLSNRRSLGWPRPRWSSSIYPPQHASTVAPLDLHRFCFLPPAILTSPVLFPSSLRTISAADCARPPPPRPLRVWSTVTDRYTLLGVSKISGILWDFLPAAEKSLFRARAAHAKAQHKKLYPNYKYSPQVCHSPSLAPYLPRSHSSMRSPSQVKDKTVKRRVGKKMPTEKRERLEEMAGAIVRGLGWAAEDVDVTKRSGTPASTKAPEVPLPSASDMPGTSAFGVPGYEHQPQHKTGSAPPPQFDNMGVPMSAVDPSSSYGLPNMERRPSSCPPPNAHLAWGEQQQLQAQTPPAFGTEQQAYPPAPQWAYPAPPQPQNYAFVRPGGKTARKMRTAPGTAKSQLLNGPGISRTSSKKSAERPTPTIEVPTLPKVSSEVPMTTGTAHNSAYDEPAWGIGMPYVSTFRWIWVGVYTDAHSAFVFSRTSPSTPLLREPTPAAPRLLFSWRRRPSMPSSTTSSRCKATTMPPRRSPSIPTRCRPHRPSPSLTPTLLWL